MQIKNKDAAYNYGRAIGERMREKFPPRIILHRVWALIKWIYDGVFIYVLLALTLLLFPTVLDELTLIYADIIKRGEAPSWTVGYAGILIFSVILIKIAVLYYHWCRRFVKRVKTK